MKDLDFNLFVVLNGYEYVPGGGNGLVGGGYSGLPAYSGTSGAVPGGATDPWASYPPQYHELQYGATQGGYGGPSSPSSSAIYPPGSGLYTHQGAEYMYGCLGGLDEGASMGTELHEKGASTCHLMEYVPELAGGEEDRPRDGFFLVSVKEEPREEQRDFTSIPPINYNN